MIIRPKEQGALLIPAVVALTILAVLAAGVARVQSSRADIAAELAGGMELGDLAQIGLNLTISGLNATACTPQNLVGAAIDSDGRTTISRTVTDAGTLAISFCPSKADCYAADWGVSGKSAAWVALINATADGVTRSHKAGINDNGICDAVTGAIILSEFSLTHWQ